MSIIRAFEENNNLNYFYYHFRSRDGKACPESLPLSKFVSTGDVLREIP